MSGDSLLACYSMTKGLDELHLTRSGDGLSLMLNRQEPMAIADRNIAIVAEAFTRGTTNELTFWSTADNGGGIRLSRLNGSENPAVMEVMVKRSCTTTSPAWTGVHRMTIHREAFGQFFRHATPGQLLVGHNNVLCFLTTDRTRRSISGLRIIYPNQPGDRIARSRYARCSSTRDGRTIGNERCTIFDTEAPHRELVSAWINGENGQAGAA